MKFKTAFTFWLPIVYCMMLAAYIGIRYLNDGVFLSRLGGLSGHTWAWIIILMYASYLRLFLDTGYKGLFKWIITVLFSIAIIEGVFQVAFILSDLWHNWTAVSSVGIMLFSITLGIISKSYKMFNYAYLLPFFMFMIIWFFIGMPTTVNNNTGTEYYYNIHVNMIEIFQWILGIGGLFFGLKKDMGMKLDE